MCVCVRACVAGPLNVGVPESTTLRSVLVRATHTRTEVVTKRHALVERSQSDDLHIPSLFPLPARLPRPLSRTTT